MVVGWFAVRVEEIELGPQESHCSRRRLVPVLEGVGPRSATGMLAKASKRAAACSGNSQVTCKAWSQGCCTLNSSSGADHL